MKKRFVFLITLIAIFSYSTVAQIKVDCSGNVGINCTPSYKFDVYGNTRFQGCVGINCPPGVYKFAVDGNTNLLGPVGIGTGFDDDYILKTTGNVWISDGNLLIGRSTIPKPYVKVLGIATPDIVVKAIYDSYPQYNVGSLGTSSDQWLNIYGENIYAVHLYTGSDLMLKENIRDLENSLEKIELLRPVKFDFKPYPEPDLQELRNIIIEQNERRKNKTGFIAQEVLNVIPDIVEYDSTGDNYYIDYNAIIPYLVEAIQEQQTMIENLINEISALKSESSSNLKSVLITTDGNLSEQGDQPILFQNKPNPFNEDTKIKFYIPEGFNEAKLNIYNMQGGQIKSILIIQRSYGTEIINGYDLQPGMYLYSLIVDGGEVDTKRMILTD